MPRVFFWRCHEFSAIGASWDIIGALPSYHGATGAGYSDMHLLPRADDAEGDVLGVAFQRTLWDPNLEGEGYNMGWAIVDLSS